MHRSRWLIPSTEASLTAHLSVSYASQPATSPLAVAGTLVGAVADVAQAAHNPLGFLAELVGHLVSTAATAQPAPTVAPVDFGTAAPQVASLGHAVKAATGTVSRQAIHLLRDLTKQLSDLQSQLDAGQTPDPALLQRLGQTVDALAALIPAPAAPAQSTDTTTATLDPLAIGATVSPLTTSDAQATGDASSGGGTSSDPDASPPASVPLPALAELAQKLSSASHAVIGSAPDIARKLEALSTRIGAAEANPSLLAQLDPDAAQTGGAELDAIVRSLMDVRPVAQVPAPRLSDNAQLALPAPLVETKPKSAAGAIKPVAEPKPKLPEPAPAKPAAPQKSADPAPEPQAEAKVIASNGAVASNGDTSADTSSAIASVATPATGSGATPRALPAAYQPVASPINMTQVAFEMVRQARQGSSRFAIRLDPPELGRVDVKLHVDATGAVNAKLTVERSETLDMFQRDRGTLEKALAQAGLEPGKTNLEFSLKQNPFAGMTGGDQRQQGSGFTPRFATGEAEDSSAPVSSITLYRGTVSSGGVNLFV